MPSVGRRNETSSVPWSSRYRRIFDYWNRIDAGLTINDPDKQTEPEPEPEVEVELPDKTALKVTKVNMNLETNGKAHKTLEFDKGETHLIVRRGLKFDLDLEFNRPYEQENDDLRILLEFGKAPKKSNKTQVEFILSAKDVKHEWGAFIQSQTGNSINVGVVSPPTCYVGQWKLKIDVVKVGEEEESVYRYNHRNPIYVLFNPWCKDDTVYMHDTELLKEYVLEEFGVIFIGSSSKPSFKVWNFGQFESPVLDCCMYLLDEFSKMQPQVRGDPMKVVRKLSALINAQDEAGVLVGNWSESYEGGTSPLDWVGSQKILKEFYENKKPVKFGQCWVFSAVFTTICRALGIPARSVTNFSSAHDTDGSITIDKHFDEDGKPIKDLNSDSIWNFHVWNDTWMTRPDLPPGYGGWQAVDATPQELSDGVYCMGPMSVRAIKHGEVYMNYDGAFVFSEVNADVFHWEVKKDGSITRIGIEKNSVGKILLTKKPMTLGVHNVTWDYKFEEKSNEERAAMYVANLTSSSPVDYPELTGTWDVEFEVNFNKDTFIGDSMVVELVAKNTSDEPRTLEGTMVLSTVYYTGVHHKDVKTQKIEGVKIAPGETEVIGLKVKEGEYWSLLMDHCMFGLSGVVLVTPTNQYTPVVADFRLRKPHLSVKAEKTGKKGETIPVEVSFKNPLSVPLTDCTLIVEGAGLQEPRVITQADVPSKEEFIATFDVTPRKVGKREVSIAFNSAQLKSISGSHLVTVS